MPKDHTRQTMNDLNGQPSFNGIHGEVEDTWDVGLNIPPSFFFLLELKLKIIILNL